ncbi:hypothetical protein LJ737_06975 [Hymenobacter sp. 15J16-1T3B]|uniref:hypothetical protein n=1 Tax=Hymenobacter sp. 15J16-1T3B TaxID=2886941 RepID=UPI001D1200E1|nr:hypothetical protein [Hymenobacter sp. 15J16-1T3B]MCC3156973.1 hypothetical protein [Hymenobacter sp. 15J16-1T3B]
MSPPLFFLRARCPAAGLLLAGLLGACQAGPSEAELRQYQSLDQTLTLLNRRQQRAARATEQRLAKQVEHNHWLRQDAAVLSEVEAIRTRTDSLVGQLQQLRQQLQVGSGKAADPAATAPVEALLGGPGADTVQQRLNAYARFIRRFVPQAAPLALDVRDEARIDRAARKQLAAWRFGQLYFRGAPLASALAMLSQKEAEIRRLEHDALAELDQKVAAPFIVFDKIGPMAVPESNEVPVGGTYRAALFLTSSAVGIRPVMQADGRPVPLTLDGRGRVEFVVPATAPAGPASWEASIALRQYGRDTTFRLRVPYTIQPR